jgi:putative heme-binding domain-containing protein
MMQRKRVTSTGFSFPFSRSNNPKWDKAAWGGSLRDRRVRPVHLQSSSGDDDGDGRKVSDNGDSGRSALAFGTFITKCLALLLFMSLGHLAVAQDDAESARKDRLKVEALMRLKVDVNKDPKQLETVKRHLARLGTDPAQLKVWRQLNPSGMNERLFELIAQWQKAGLATESIQAMDLALGHGAKDTLLALLTAEEPTPQAMLLSKVIASSDHKEVADILGKLIAAEKLNSQIRIDASIGFVRFPEGQKQLIALAKENRLPAEAKLLVGSALRNSADEAIRKAAEDLFPAKKTAGADLPPMEELAKRRGNIENGKTLFDGVATCGQCHTVRGAGKNVGPDLSEIGSKLSREAMYISILDPSAGISHNYEAYSVLLDSGSVVTGLLVSKTDSTIILKDAKGVERRFESDEIEEFKKQEKSLMPDNLQETMNEDGLVDVVEYLISLQKPTE